MQRPTIRQAASSEADAVIAILALAFASDPVARYWWRTPADHLTWMPKLAHAMGERAFQHGTVDILSDFSAAAVWLPPGIVPDDERIAALNMPGDKALFAEFGAAMDAHHPKAPHWYLWMIGADPRRQGEGLGSALLKHRLALIDAKGETAYLESSNPKNVALYERHGFEAAGTIRVRDVPPLTPMIRHAR